MSNFHELCTITNRELAPAMTRLAYRYIETDVLFAYALLARAAVLWCPMAMTIIALLMKRKAGRLPKIHRGYSWSWWSWSVAILLHNSTTSKVAEALLKRVPQNMVKNIHEWKFCSEYSWMVFEKIERMICAFYQLTKDDPSKVFAAMTTCGTTYRSKYGVDFFNPLQPDKEEMQILELLGLVEKPSRKKRQKIAKKEIIDKPKEMYEIIDDAIHGLGGETVARRVVDGFAFSIHYLNGKVFLSTEFEKTGIWFAKAYFRPRWSSSGESVPSPVFRLYSLLRFFRERLHRAVDVVSFVAFKRDCDVVEMDERCIDGWKHHGVFGVFTSERPRFLSYIRTEEDKFPSLDEFLVSKVGKDMSEPIKLECRSLSTELKKALEDIVEAVSGCDYCAETHGKVS